MKEAITDPKIEKS